MDPTPDGLTATAALDALRSGQLSVEAYTRALLDQIERREPIVKAWAFLDREYALAQARRLDGDRKAGKPLGALHGVPVGVKDIFDTADMPTENGTVLHSGRRPDQDAMAVALLRAAGAVILGKTMTTELAVYSPAQTTNPLDPRRTPGGSSSGSAAAVAAHMAPLAIGSQTNGSVIRPAAYCGVYGYKPSRGLISRAGVLAQSWHLDHVGVFGRCLEDIAVLAEVLMAFDPRDSAMRPQAPPGLLERLSRVPAAAPRLAFVRSPFWGEATQAAQAAFLQLAERLGGQAEEVELPMDFAAAADIHRTILEADLAGSFAEEYTQAADRLSPMLRSMIERGQRTFAVEYNRAVMKIPRLCQELEPIFAGHDAILTPATMGEAPLGLESTGSPIFCTIWTLCGAPSLTLPLLRGGAGLPIGVQLVGRPGEDARLLQTARRLEKLAAG